MILLIVAAIVFVYYIICIINPTDHKLGLCLLSFIFGLFGGFFEDDAKEFIRKK